MNNAHEKLCNAIKHPNEAHDYGWLLFPGQGVTERRPVIARIEDVERGVREGHFKKVSAISLHLIGCVDYQSTLNPAKHHQTKFVHLVGRVDPQRGVVNSAFDPKVTSYDHIVVTPTLHGASAD